MTVSAASRYTAKVERSFTEVALPSLCTAKLVIACVYTCQVERRIIMSAFVSILFIFTSYFDPLSFNIILYNKVHNFRGGLRDILA